MERHTILGIHVTDRIKKVPNVQKVLSEYGCNIKTRIGLHDATADLCSSTGVILLELVGDKKKCSELADKLGAIEGLQVKKMIFSA